MSHLQRAKADERIVSDKYWRAGAVALRCPISGGGRFKGDVFAITDKGIEFCLVRRTEKDSNIKFNSREIKETIELAKKVESLLRVPVFVKLIAHFPKRRRWDTRIVYETGK